MILLIIITKNYLSIKKCRSNQLERQGIDLIWDKKLFSKYCYILKKKDTEDTTIFSTRS